MFGLTNFQKNIITAGFLIVGLFFLLKTGIPSIFGFSDTVNNLTQSLAAAQQQNADLMVQIDSITTLTTTDKDKLEKQLSDMLKTNDELKKKISSLQGQLTQVHQGQGNVVITDTTHAGETDSLIFASDNFLNIKYNKFTKDFIWKFSGSIVLNGVEYTDSHGNRQNVEEVYLISNDGAQKITIPWTASFVALKSCAKLWRYNPSLHAQTVFRYDDIAYGLSTNLFTFGTDKYPETTIFYIANVGLTSDFKENIYLTIAPISYNIGRPIPLITNLNISPALSIGKKGLSFSVIADIVL